MPIKLKDTKEDGSIIESITNEEMQDFFIWLYDKGYRISHDEGLFDNEEIQSQLTEFRDEKKRV